MKTLRLLLSCVLLFPSLLYGATCTWLGGNGDWDTPTNWSCGTVPGPLDDVIISTASMVTRNSGVTVQSLTLQNIGSNLKVDGDLTITGLLTWEAGKIRGPGKLICNGGALFQTTSTKTLEDKDMELNANSTWSGGMIIVPQATVLTVGSGVQWEITGSDILRPVLGNTGILVNDGTILKSAGMQTTFEVVDVTNNGSITVNMGTLQIRGCECYGTITIGAYGVLQQYQHTFNLYGGSSIAGSGTFMIGTAGSDCVIHPTASISSPVHVNGGTFEVNENSTIPSLTMGTLSSTTITGSGQLMVSNNTQWDGGTFLNMASGVQLNGMVMMGGSTKIIENTALDIPGNATWSAGQIQLKTGGSANIKCIFDTLTTNQTIQQSPTTAPNTLFEVTTAYYKLGTAVTQINVPFMNQGSLEVHAGVLEIEEGTSSGPVLITTGSTLRKVGISTTTFTMNSGLISGAGNLEIVGGNLEIAGANVDTDVELDGLGKVIYCFPDTIGALTLNGGTLSTMDDLWVTGLFSVLSGGNTLNGGGAIHTMNNSLLDFSSELTLNDLSLEFNSNTDWLGGNLRLESNGQVINKAGYTLSINNVQNRSMKAVGGSNTQVFTNDGILRNLTTSRISFDSNLPVTNVGSIEGLGIYDFDDPLTNAGIIAPGLSPGEMTIVGSIVNSNIMNFELQDNMGTVELDELPVRGSFSAGGTLNVTATGNIPVGNYPLIFCDSLPNCISGTFAVENIPPGTSIQYSANEIVLVVGIALPIELGAFSAREVDRYNLLEWSTQLEINSFEFRIERSINGITFGQIGTVPAAGNSYSVKDYRFCDYSAPTEAYYRLKMVDEDGSYRYSEVRFVERADLLVHVYPNPFVSWVEIDMAEPLKIAEYRLHDERGALVRSGLFEGSRIDLADLPSGVYTLSLLDRIREVAHRISIVRLD